MEGYQSYQAGPAMDHDVESQKLLSPQNSAPSLHSVYINKGGNSVLVKAKLRGRHRQFEVPTDFKHSQMLAVLQEKLDMVDQVGAHVGTAYLLWLFFGFFGIHRFYLKQHNATSWAIWFFTGQLFGFGWIFDGFMLASNVRKFNSRTLYKYSKEPEAGFYQLLFGFKEEERPNLVAAYLLWFFFGSFGIHRWYTGYHSPSSFTAWLLTFQICWIGWFYDAYYTFHMVNYPRLVADGVPFYIKAHDKYDYMPVANDVELSSTLNNAFLKSDKTLRILVVEKKREDYAYLAWLFFGIFGAHALYLNMGSMWTRVFSGNYFWFGWVADGIRLQDEIARANSKIAGDFVPSMEGNKVWPHYSLGVVGVASSVENV